MKTIIVIPARMASTRFPNKPMALIRGKPMIQRVWEQAKLANSDSLIVACCDKEVFNFIKSIGGEAFMTSPTHPSGTDRVFEVVKNLPNINSFDSIINLQGDMPLINPNDIIKVNNSLLQGFDIGTLVTDISADEECNENITKVNINWINKKDFGEATDFYKISKDIIKNIYHHVGIYSFTYQSLKNFITLPPSSNELLYKLEQLRAIDAKMKIGASFVKNVALSVDTKEDLIKVESILKFKNE